MSRVVHRSLIAAALLAVALALPSAAHASAGAVIRDCAQDGDLDRHYSNAELRQALHNLPSDLDEYSDCRDVIGAAITGGAGRGGGAGGGHGPAGGTAAAAAAKHRAHGGRAAHNKKAVRPAGKPTHHPFRAGGHLVEPGKNGLFKPASATQSLPLPLLLALIAAGVAAATAGALALRQRLPDLRRRLPDLSKLPLPSVPLPRLLRR